jgi:hypothetical protein
MAVQTAQGHVGVEHIQPKLLKMHIFTVNEPEEASLGKCKPHMEIMKSNVIAFM